MRDDDIPSYHATAGYVHAGPWAFELGPLWASIDEIERGSGITLDQIGSALVHNWTAAVIALALNNIAVLRALIDEVSRSRPPSPWGGA
jgi:hypothetical protein